MSTMCITEQHFAIRQVGSFSKRFIPAKNELIATGLLTSCNNVSQQADIRIRSHGLRQLVDDKSVAC